MFGSIFAAEADVGAPGVGASSSVDLAYGPSSSGSSDVHPLHPGTGFGLGFWLGLGGLVLLVGIRRSLPS